MSVKKIFQKMDYGPAPEASDEAIKWLEFHNRKFGHYINGEHTSPENLFPTKNPANGEILAEISQAGSKSVELAVTSARNAQPSWEKQGGHERAKILYAIARLLQKHSRLFATLETLDNGKPIRESRDIDVPLAQRHFYYHAGMAQLMHKELPNARAIGVCGQIIPWNFPLLMLAWKICPAIAMGNTVILKPAEYTPLTALFFSQICREAGIPKGVVNIIFGDGQVGRKLVSHPGIDKIAFTGSTDVGREIRQTTAGSGKKLTLELGGKSPFIVFEDSDLDSAVEGLVDAIWFNQGEVCCAGSRLLVQEGVSDVFYKKIRQRMEKLRIGDPLDKSVDIGAIVDQTQLGKIQELVNQNNSGNIFQAPKCMPDVGNYYPPTLITGLSPSHKLMQEEIFGPVLTATTFRTPKEAISLANNSRYGLAASIWSENINLCLGLAPYIKAGVIWINGTNMFDASAAFGGMRESGIGREGGWEGLSSYTFFGSHSKKKLKAVKANKQCREKALDLDRTAKLYIGGKQTRPDSGYSQAIYNREGSLIGHVSIANRKDIRNAVESAAEASAWSLTSGHHRAQILYYIAENLSARKKEFVERIDNLTGNDHGITEFEKSVDRLFTYASWADKFDGQVRNVPIRGLSLKINEPKGIIAAFCSDTFPLLGLVSILAPSLAMGNRVICVASQPYPLIATDFYQVLETSDVPPGVANILTGVHSELCDPIALHNNIDSVWSFSSTDLSKRIEELSATNLKSTWVNFGRDRDWLGDESEGKAFLEAATEVKTIWIPFGEG